MKQQKKIRKTHRRIIQEDCLDSWVNTNEYLLSKFSPPSCIISQAPGSMLEFLLKSSFYINIQISNFINYQNSVISEI
ncbi:unnamed protein product [Paramecium primaurelia]|uniref:Uncharacterized protein n=1 Tax=Paramecium primaurelia TaxID=5886 RepID=A0A8S1K9Z0_PARPR|nr:unnamed protein product [Paramecium primaurelia]